jgi:hypothetical protein
MTPPIDPKALQMVVQALPPEREEPFSHLAFLCPNSLLQRRVEISGQIKMLEQERQVIDAELSAVFAPAELRRGVRAPAGGWVLQERTRTSWSYPSFIKEQVRTIQKNAQSSGKAQEMRTTYPVLTREDS